jgi:DNA-binding IclR family transcriptional regulator
MPNLDERRIATLRTILILELTIQVEMLARVRREPGMLIGEIASKVDLPVKRAQPLVRSLRAEGLLRTEGSGRGTRYFISEVRR